MTDQPKHTPDESIDRPSDYQSRDADVIDYGMTDLTLTSREGRETTHRVRGPIPDLDSGNFITCIGAAQTFGCFCENPYPALLADRLALPALNLGLGGIGPIFLLNHPELIDTANRGRLTVLQILSGRMQPTPYFDSSGLTRVRLRRNGRLVHPHVAWSDIAEGGYLYKKLGPLAPLARPLVRAAARPVLSHALRSARLGYIADYQRLLDRLTTPVIVLWFSRRTPEYPRRPRPIQSLVGEYPQLVDRDWFAPIATHAGRSGNRSAEVVTDRGTPQPLVNKDTGEPCEIDLGKDSALYAGQTWRENSYYPTPEMHEDAADALEPIARDLLG